ncbi:hypothetical protein L1987_64829 [Smallanthus sonchifolius]|uniref:Uncharacterized protein n=1 Tax=Smallanthus sonchifolius TaxID=185202 RepID=A0ACB9BSM8_9ASTR|nr:hypothetical protein L1987_64829 [Smallanthus sonchifolius]
MLPTHPDFGLLGSSSIAPDEEPDKTKNWRVWKNVEVCTRIRVEDVATGADEAPYATRKRSKTGAKTSTSSSRPKRRGLVDEDFDAGVEENDVAAYKDFVPTSECDDDETEYEDLDDL